MTSGIGHNVCLFFAVGYHVRLQLPCSTKCLFAVWTNLHLFSTVGEHMSRQFTLKTRWFGTLCTMEFICHVELKDVKLSLPLSNLCVMIMLFSFSLLHAVAFCNNNNNFETTQGPLSCYRRSVPLPSTSIDAASVLFWVPWWYKYLRWLQWSVLV